MAKLSITQRKRLSPIQAFFYTKSVKEGWEDKFVASYNKKQQEGENYGKDAQ